LPGPAIGYRDIVQIVGIDPFQAANVEAEFPGVGAASVVCIDAADPAKEVLGHPHTELIFHQCAFTADDLHVLFRDCRDNGAFALAERAVTSVWGRESVGQVDFKNDSATMATGPVMELNWRICDLLEHESLPGHYGLLAIAFPVPTASAIHCSRKQ